jgi:hypothetical protein
MMKRRYKNLKQAMFIGLIAVVGVSGCKKFLDVNQNPNNPDHADPTLLLPTTQAAVSQVIGNSFQVFGNMWAQYWTQSPVASQYKANDQYAPLATSFDRPWLNLYRVALVNADLITKSSVSGLENVKGIAYLMKAYGYQVATDAFGDVPLSQALQPSAYQNPKYDSQQAVYDSILMYIDKAMPLLKANAVSPGGQDLIYHGDMTKWVAFANTLELRVYLRLSNVDPNTAKAGIAALYQSNPTFLTEDATITYTSTGGNENPFYNEATSPTLGGVQNVVASSTVVDAFTNNNDPRLGKFFSLFIDKKSPVDSLESIPQGSYLSYVNKKVSTPSPLVGGKADDPTSATAPVKLISAAESYFLQAEAVARGWAAGDATSLYKQGIQASFTATGAGDATAYIAGLQPAFTTALSVNDQVKAIITQKYYAMCGFQGFEAWNEWRRTGFPTFFVQSAATTITPGQWPLRMLYPNSELTSNSNYPGTIPIYKPVWWGLPNP